MSTSKRLTPNPCVQILRVLIPLWIGHPDITVKLSIKKDGTPHLQTYNWNLCKIAHLREGAQEATRPRPGRPAKQNTATASSSSETRPATSTAMQVPDPPLPSDTRTSKTTTSSEKSSSPSSVKEKSKTSGSSSRSPHPDYIRRGPLITEHMFNQWTPDLLNLPDRRTARSTRNPDPKYIDSIT